MDVLKSGNGTALNQSHSLTSTQGRNLTKNERDGLWRRVNDGQKMERDHVLFFGTELWDKGETTSSQSHKNTSLRKSSSFIVMLASKLNTFNLSSHNLEIQVTTGEGNITILTHKGIIWSASSFFTPQVVTKIITAGNCGKCEGLRVVEEWNDLREAVLTRLALSPNKITPRIHNYFKAHREHSHCNTHK